MRKIEQFKTIGRKRIQDLICGYLFLSPALLFLGIFVAFPIVYSLVLSFYQWDFISPIATFIGIKNYIRLFTSRESLSVMRNTVVFSALSIPASIVLALFFALLLDKAIKGKSVMRAAIFLPWVIPTVNIGLLWMLIYDPGYGIMNQFLETIGLPRLQWLGSMEWSLPALIIINIWKYTGYYMVLFIAGLQNIPQEIHEAARIDGVTRREDFWHVTLPLLSPMTFLVFVISIINSFKVFDLVYIMTAGGPAESTNMLVFYLYESGFRMYEIGYASAIAVIFLAMLLVLTLGQFKISRRWVHY